MVKKLLMGTGGLVLALNASAVFYPDPNVKAGVEITSALLGLAVLFFASKASAPQLPPAAATSPITPSAPPPPPPRAEAEIVAFLALLQEQGRLVDFVKEDVAAASDQQLGAAARVVHAGCRKVLEEYFDIATVQTGNEGDKVVLASGYDAAAHRLLGAVPENPPYSGKLLHPGWVARSVKLPRVTGTTEQRPWPVLAPAEVEIGAA